jgi:prophage DNA circulation protein
MSGGHTQAQRDYPFIDAAGHDNVRRDPMRFSFTLYFINGIKKTTSTRLFPELFIDWQNAFIFNGAEGTIVHPIMGEVLVRPGQWNVELTAQRTSGVIMTVEFTETLHDPSETQDIEGAAIAIRELAQKADEAVERSFIDYPTGERTDNLLDLVNQIESFVFSAKLSIQGIQNQALGIVNGMLDDVNSLQDHAEWATHDALLDLWAGIKEIGERVGFGRPRDTAFIVLTRDMTLDEIGAEVGNTAGEIITLNPNLLGDPIISEGTSVEYFTESAT